MKTTQPLLSMKKLLIAGALALFQHAAFAQNVVLNPSFEGGNTPTGNGPYYVGDPAGWVQDWTGINVPFGVWYNSGNLYSNLATGTFWRFPAGLSAYAGNRAVKIVMSHDANGYFGSRVAGRFSAPLGEGCYSLCVHFSGTGVPPQTADNKVEVVIYSSAGGAASERIIETFTISKNLGWRNVGKMFNVPFFKRGFYDRVLFRIKESAVPLDEYHGVYIDLVSISSCGTTGVATLNPDFNYQVRPFEGGIGPIVVADGNEDTEGAIHRWDLSYANGPTASGEEPQWIPLPDNSFTTLTAHYESGVVGIFGSNIIYKLDHLFFSPCGSLVVRAYDLSTHMAVASTSTFVPTGDEYPDNGGGNFVRNAKGNTAGINKKQELFALPADAVLKESGPVQLFSFSPNPANNELNVQIGEDIEVTQQTSAIDVVNDKGATVLTSNRISHNNKLDLGDLPKGIYYIRVVTDNRVEVKKFVKQ